MMNLIMSVLLMIVLGRASNAQTLGLAQWSLYIHRFTLYRLNLIMNVHLMTSIERVSNAQTLGLAYGACIYSNSHFIVQTSNMCKQLLPRGSKNDRQSKYTCSTNLKSQSCVIGSQQLWSGFDLKLIFKVSFSKCGQACFTLYFHSNKNLWFPHVN